MRRLAILSLILLAALVLSGCSGQPVPSAASAPAVTGKVTYTESVTLPDKAMVTVQLRDTGLWPDATGLISQQQIGTSGNQGPIPFNVTYNSALIQKDHNYAMAAFIQDGNGHLLFVPGAPVPVVTNGNPIQDVQVTVVPAQNNAAITTTVPTEPTWNAIMFNNGSSGIASVMGVAITAQFGTDGKLSGFGGCNDYSGTYTIGQDGTVKMGPISATQKTCSEPANVMQQESQYLAALQSAATFQVQGSSLTAQNTDGQLAVQYERSGP
jgi:putative lipoprotein